MSLTYERLIKFDLEEISLDVNRGVNLFENVSADDEGIISQWGHSKS